jgi:MoaA/NifB/PqqE/SkfB family radical SAM enzyme
LTVTRETISKLAGKVAKLTFSVDGHCSEVHDQIRRRPGSFDKVVRAVRYSVEAGIPTHMISVVWRKSVDHVPALIALAEDLGVDRLLLFSCGKIGAAESHWDELSCDSERWVRYLHEVKELARTRPWVWFELDRVPRSDLSTFIDESYRPICTRKIRDSITIDPL